MCQKCKDEKQRALEVDTGMPLVSAEQYDQVCDQLKLANGIIQGLSDCGKFDAVTSHTKILNLISNGWKLWNSPSHSFLSASSGGFRFEIPVSTFALVRMEDAGKIEQDGTTWGTAEAIGYRAVSPEQRKGMTNE